MWGSPDYLIIAEEIARAGVEFNKATVANPRLGIIGPELFRFSARDLPNNHGGVADGTTFSQLTQTESLMVLDSVIRTFPFLANPLFRYSLGQMKKRLKREELIGSVRASTVPEPSIIFKIEDYTNNEIKRIPKKLEIQYLERSIDISHKKWQFNKPYSSISFHLMKLISELDSQRFGEELRTLIS